MSSLPLLDRAEIEAVYEWLEEGQPDPSSGVAGDGLLEWATARGIDLEPVLLVAFQHATRLLQLLGAGAYGGSAGAGSQALASAAILGFQLGIDCERRRRDGQLPDPELPGDAQ